MCVWLGACARARPPHAGWVWSVYKILGQEHRPAIQPPAATPKTPDGGGAAAAAREAQNGAGRCARPGVTLGFKNTKHQR